MDDWQKSIDAVWADPTLDDHARTAAIDALCEGRADDPRALFERAGARDSAGQEQLAEPLYRAALAGGLDAERRTRANIQLASTLRNLGRTDEALDMLAREYENSAGESLHDAAAAFYALALSSAGDGRAALSVALTALAPHLPRYTRSVTGYAAELVDAADGMPTANTGEGGKSRR